jgi:hypothetical protein
LVRFLLQTCRTGQTDQSQKVGEFLAWADAHIANLRENCPAPVVDVDVTESGIW